MRVIAAAMRRASVATTPAVRVANLLCSPARAPVEPERTLNLSLVTRHSSLFLVSLDLCRVHHASPAREFVLHHLAEALRAAADGRHALVGEQFADVGQVEERVDIGVHLAYHRRRRGGRCEYAVPGLDLELGESQL